MEIQLLLDLARAGETLKPLEVFDRITQSVLAVHELCGADAVAVLEIGKQILQTVELRPNAAFQQIGCGHAEQELDATS
jgi:hypothetical protein